MKIYCFFQYDKNMSRDEYISLMKRGFKRKDINSLYAITNKKKFAKKFMEERNMNKFLMFKYDIEENLYIELANKRRGIVLDEYNYRYYPRVKENSDDSKVVSILSTYMERMTIDSQADQSLLGFSESINFQDPFCLKKDLLNDLRTLEYVTMYKMYIANSLSFDSKYIPIDEEGYLEMPAVLIDELQLFILNFGKLFK